MQLSKSLQFKVSLHAQNQEFARGVQARLPENSSDNVFYFVLFFSLQLILQFHSGLSMVYFKENYNFPRFQRGSDKFQGGSNFFQRGGVQMLLLV